MPDLFSPLDLLLKFPKEFQFLKLLLLNKPLLLNYSLVSAQSSKPSPSDPPSHLVLFSPSRFDHNNHRAQHLLSSNLDHQHSQRSEVNRCNKCNKPDHSNKCRLDHLLSSSRLDLRHSNSRS